MMVSYFICPLTWPRGCYLHLTLLQVHYFVYLYLFVMEYVMYPISTADIGLFFTGQGGGTRPNYKENHVHFNNTHSHTCENAWTAHS